MESENDAQVGQNEQNKTKTSLSSDEKAPDSSDNGTVKNRAGFSKGKKRKKLKDSTAPRQPLTGKKVNASVQVLHKKNVIF